MSRVTHTHMYESCQTYVSLITNIWVMSCVWVMPCIYESCHTYMSHVTHIWVIPHIHESCRAFRCLRIYKIYSFLINYKVNAFIHMQWVTNFGNLTSCNAPQHTVTATHCNTLQHNATHCNTLQDSSKHCDMLQHTATRCNTLQHSWGCGKEWQW